MDQTIVVTRLNCEAVANRIIDLLAGKTFKVNTYYHYKGTKEAPRVWDRSTIDANYRYNDGCLIIYLHPRRRLMWDLGVENVMVTFLDSGDLMIERTLSGDRTLYRVVNLL